MNKERMTWLLKRLVLQHAEYLLYAGTSGFYFWYVEGFFKLAGTFLSYEKIEILGHVNFANESQLAS